MSTVVIFRLDKQGLALSVNSVQCVLLAVEITRVPGQSANLIGVIDTEDSIIPIIDLRKILGLPARELELEDHILVVNTNFGAIGMIVDAVDGVLDYEDKQFTAVWQPSRSYTAGILKIGEQLFAVIEPSKLVSSDDLALFASNMLEQVS